MDVTTEHLEAIRRVLNTEVTLREVATDYSPVLKTMVGIAILQGANVREEDLVKPRGMYSRLLQELTITPGIPVDGWLEGDGFPIWPTWYDEVSRNTLVGRARTYGFHETKHRQGHGLTFVGHPAFQRLLLEDESFTKTCRLLYDKARKAITDRRIEEAARRKISTASVRQGTAPASQAARGVCSDPGAMGEDDRKSSYRKLLGRQGIDA